MVEALRFLRDNRVQPYAHMWRSDREPATAEVNAESDVARPMIPTVVRYSARGATAGFVVWGINDWKILPRQNRAQDTEVVNLVMRTPARLHRGALEATIAVPQGARLDLGFLITECEGDHYKRVSVYEGFSGPTSAAAHRLEFKSLLSCYADASIGIASEADVMTRELRYRNNDAAKVSVRWGVNGNYPVAPDIRPPGTTLIYNQMRTEMRADGAWFTASLTAPLGSRVTYTIVVERRKGILSLLQPVRDFPGSEVRFEDDGPILLTSSVPLPNEIADSTPVRGQILKIGLAWLSGWGVLSAALRLIGHRRASLKSRTVFE